ncbi:hypothetical protein ACHAWO_009281 [Cyclotella atomus]|uniref:HMG box domain-containing protein n=1 Tax=Cyclotella atomus TaxID=382360 RepID=A0ABD3NEE3_9STRA
MSAKEPEELKDGEIPPIPKRPLTAYNIFSVLERHYILEQSEYAASKSAEDDEDVVDQTLDPHYARRPPRYKNVTLPANWYVVSKNKKKRGDHKCHGLVGFKQLSKMIADAWAQADEYTKEYCKSISQSELANYRAEQEAFKEKYGEEAFEKQTRKRKNAEAAERGDIKKSKSLKKYEEALKVLGKNEEESEDESEEEKEDGKVPAIGDKPAVAAAVVAPQAGRIPALLNPLERLLQERQMIAQRLHLLTYGSAAATQENDQLGQAIRSMNHERMIAQELAIQQALRQEALLRSHQGIASMPNPDPRLAAMQMELLRREENLARAIARTRVPVAAAAPSTQVSSTSTSEKNRLEELSLRLGGAAQRERLAHIMRPGNWPEKAVSQETRQPLLSDTDQLARNAGNRTGASANLSSTQQQQQQQGSSLLGEGGGSSVDRRNSPQQQQPENSQQQQDRTALIMSLEGLDGKSLSERMAALSNPVVLDYIENLQRLQQRRLLLQEQMLQQRSGQAAVMPARMNALYAAALTRQLTPEEILMVERRRTALLETLKK